MKKSVPFARRFKQVVSGAMIALAASVARDSRSPG